MKLTTTLSALAIVAGGWSAAQAASPTVESKAMLSIDGRQPAVQHNPKTRMALPAFADGELADFISKVPESAEKKVYSRDWKGFWVFNYLFSAIMQGEENERVQYLYFDGDDVYLPTPVLSFEAPSYIKGKKTADGNITFPLPQCVYSYYDTENGVRERKDFYVDFLYWDLDFNNYYTADVAEEHSFDLTLEADGTYRWVNEEIVTGPNPDNPDEMLRFMKRILGIVNQDEIWAGYADYKTVMTPFTTPLVEVPEDAHTTIMTLTSEDVSRKVNVAFKGDKVWVQGFSVENPGSWVMGTIADGVASFGRQYVGIDADNYYFGTFSGATSEMGYNEILEQPELIVTALEEAKFNYDKENYTLTATTDVMIGGGQDCEFAIEFMAKPVLKGRAVTNRPATPEIESWYNYNPDFGYGRVIFDAPVISETGQKLDAEKMSWSIEIDGEMYEWDPSKHKKIPEAMTWVPYTFTDSDDVVFEGENGRKCFFRKKVEHYLAVRVRYLQPSGNYIVSQYALATTDNFNIADWPSLNEPPAGEDDADVGVIQIDADDADIQVVEYYDLSGRRLHEAPAKGICLMRVVFTNGNARTLKIAR